MVLERAAEIARRHGLKGVTGKVYDYLNYAVEAHLVGLLTVMSRAADQRGDPLREVRGMVKTGTNLKAWLGARVREDRSRREQREAAEQARLLQQTTRNVKKMNEEDKVCACGERWGGGGSRGCSYCTFSTSRMMDSCLAH